MEASHSGLVRTLGKRVWSNPPRVRISPPPLIVLNYRSCLKNQTKKIQMPKASMITPAIR